MERKGELKKKGREKERRKAKKKGEGARDIKVRAE